VTYPIERVPGYVAPYPTLEADTRVPLAGNCAVFARMARDFGDETLPAFPGQYLPGSHAPPMQVAKWDNLTLVMGHLLSSCVGNKGEPGWSARVGDIVVFFVPQDSAFRRQWWRDGAEVGGTNSTGALSSS